MKKNRFNIIDIAIILIIILVAAVTVYRTQTNSILPGSFENEQIEYEIKIYSESIDYRNSLKNGDSIYIDGNNLFCGTVNNINTEYAYSEIIGLDGIVDKHLNQSLIDITATVTVSGDLTDSGFYIGHNTYLSVGQYIDIYSSKVRFKAQIVSAVTKD